MLNILIRLLQNYLYKAAELKNFRAINSLSNNINNKNGRFAKYLNAEQIEHIELLKKTNTHLSYEEIMEKAIKDNDAEKQLEAFKMCKEDFENVDIDELELKTIRYDLAKMYRNGSGTKQDMSQAVKLLKLVKTSKSYLVLSNIYRTELLVRSLQSSFYYLEKGAHMHDAACQFKLAQCYKNG